MQTGTYISGAGHVLLIGWAIFGGAFNPEPLPFEVQEVSVISSAEFAAIVAGQEPPSTPVEPAALEPADTQVEAPEIETAPEEPVVQAAPPQPPVPEADPLPPAEVANPTPPSEDVAVVIPDARPVPRPSDRIAPEAVAPPEPEAAPDPVEQDAVVPEEGESEVPAEEQEATAPEEAATEIVTEAETPAAAPTRSLRPATRPNRPVETAAAQPEPEAEPAAEAQPEAEPEPDATADAIANAVAEAQRETQAPRAPSGPPLSAGEKDALRVAVSSCWNVGSLSTAALQTTVIVGVDMQSDGKPVTGSIRMISFDGGTEAAARQAFEAARRAIIRCGARGFQLPSEKYEQWREIEMTFNPENMRIR